MRKNRQSPTEMLLVAAWHSSMLPLLGQVQPAPMAAGCQPACSWQLDGGEASHTPDERVHHALVVAPPLDGQRGVRL
jgi:hypothetical protein